MKISFIFLCVLYQQIPLAQAQDKPNIVILMTDNQGSGDLGAYGSLRAETPRIDRLASEAIQKYPVVPSRHG